MPARGAPRRRGFQLRMGRPRAGDDRPARHLLEREDREARATASRGTSAEGAPREGLEGPILRQRRALFLVLRVVGVLLLEGLELLDQLVLIHFEHVGDHTRGLFEAPASVAASALHPLHDVAVVLFHDESLVQLDGSDSVCRDRYGVAGDRLAARSCGDAHACEDTPLLITISDAEDQERVFDDRAWLFGEPHGQGDVGLRTWLKLALDRGLLRSKLRMRLDRCDDPQPALALVSNIPADSPVSRRARARERCDTETRGLV